MFITKASEVDLLLFAALRLQEFKGSILISTLAVAQTIVNIQPTSFPSPNRSRAELTPNFLDRSTPNSVPRLSHTLAIMKIHRNLAKSCEHRTYTYK